MLLWKRKYKYYLLSLVLNFKKKEQTQAAKHDDRKTKLLVHYTVEQNHRHRDNTTPPIVSEATKIRVSFERLP